MTPRFIVKSGNLAMRVEPPSRVTFISDARLANTYSSRYAAKRHLKLLDGVPDNAEIIEFIMENVNE